MPIPAPTTSAPLIKAMIFRKLEERVPEPLDAACESSVGAVSAAAAGRAEVCSLSSIDAGSANSRSASADAACTGAEVLTGGECTSGSGAATTRAGGEEARASAPRAQERATVGTERGSDKDTA